jgi:hypothetical protein
VELAHGQHALAGGRGSDRAWRRGATRRQVLGRVGLAQRAADRAAVAHTRVGDHALGVAEDRDARPISSDSSSVAVRVMRADPQLAVLALDVVQLVRSLMSIRYSGAPAAASSSAAGCGRRRSARLGTEALEQRDRIVDARRALVLERCWYLHR